MVNTENPKHYITMELFGYHHKYALENPISESNFAEVFTEEYLREHRLVDVRLTEQMKSGTIRLDAGCVRLTDKGYRVATFGRFFRRHLLAKKRLLLDQYSDDLTDPFRASAAAPDYRCD